MIKRNWRILFVAFSQLADVTAIILSSLFLYVIDFLGFADFGTSVNFLLAAGLLYLVCYMTISTMMGLHRGSFHLSLRLQNLIMVKSYVLALLLVLTAVTFIKDYYIDRKPLILFIGILINLLLLGRLLLRQLNLYFQKKGYGVHNTLIVGYNQEVDNIINRFVSFPELGYRVKGVVTNKARNTIRSEFPQYRPTRMIDVIVKENIERVFIPSADIISNGHSSLKWISRQHGVKLKVLSPQAEDLLKISRIYDIAGITLYSPPRLNVNKAKCILKRGFDIIGASIVILLFSPILVLTIAAIYIESGRPIFFLQRRASIKGGSEFNFIKFRSMVTNAEEMKEDLRKKNETDGALFKMKNDPRITTVGRFIRKFSIDELPQLFNVLIGNMSLVGPRPLPINDFEEMNEPEEFWEAIKDRASMKPGMTGLWQISGRSDVKFKEMILLDLYYVENHSLLFDLEILFETVPVVLFGRGAY